MLLTVFIESQRPIYSISFECTALCWASGGQLLPVLLALSLVKNGELPTPILSEPFKGRRAKH